MRRREFITLAGGTSIAWPFAVHAQDRGKAHRLAILTQVEPIDRATGKRDRAWTAFFDELRRLGNEEGRNLVVMWHSSEGDAQRAGGPVDVVQVEVDDFAAAKSQVDEATDDGDGAQARG